MRRGVVSLIALGALVLPGSAQAIDYAPVDQPGPRLSVSRADLDASLQCSDGVDGASRTPILLVHGTGSNPEHNFSWNWEPALDKLGIPWCAVALPENGLADIQVAGEYVVNGIRTMYARAGRQISLIGHSQGGMLPRWALRFWPDTRALVDDVIGIAPSNHGTKDAEFSCQSSCAPANWQQSDTAQFTAALNSYQETFPGISYTVVYTHTDEIVTPNFDDTGSSSLHGGGGEITNEAVQDICPLDLTEHNGLGTVDNTAYALAIDALSHPGPADPSAIDPSVCSQPLMPGVNPATAPADAASAAADLLSNEANGPSVPSEPPLKCYVTASCASSAPATQAAAPAKKKHKHKRKCRKRKHGRCHKR
jgi:triacylglycerol esterase/lipase EstA (alpha/beta hydrolase family)